MDALGQTGPLQCRCGGRADIPGAPLKCQETANLQEAETRMVLTQTHSSAETRGVR